MPRHLKFFSLSGYTSAISPSYIIKKQIYATSANKKVQLPTLLANLHQILNICFYPHNALSTTNVDKNRHVINSHSTPHESQAAQNVEIKIEAKYERKKF